MLSGGPGRKYHRSVDLAQPVERLRTPHLVPGRRGRAPRGIVVHTTVGSFDSAAAWFEDPASGVSAHYLVGLDGRVAQFVDEHDAARHTLAVRPTSPLYDGNDPNLYTVGIEFEDGGDPDGAARPGAQYASGAALIRAIAARWSIPLDGAHVVGHRELDSSQSCPGNLDLERLLADAPDARPGRARREATARLACLLPARNAEQDLPGYLECVARFADTVVALDDGSTDRTAQLLGESPLVATVLQNPVRHGYAGWDDAANRNRLLEEAAGVDPDWILFLDADERIAPDDGEALRELVERDAVPGLAYGFRVHRMIGDPDHYDAAALWVYRLFAHRPGLRLADRRLHGVPVPADIPRSRWVRTTIRIKHLAAVDERRRRERFSKYAESDPAAAYQEAGYEHLLAAPRAPVRWQPRPPGRPLLEAGPDAWAAPLPGIVIDADLEDGPAMSAIVIAHDDERRIERSVRSVVAQECPEPIEVIVVASGSDRTAAVVRDHFPEVRVVELAGRAYPGAARNAGLAVARGEFVSFPGSHVELPPGSLAARLRAHREGHAMVTGTLLNATPTASGWASYFLDHSATLPGRPSGPLTGPPDHCSYMRHHLLQVGGFRADMRAGEDTLVNRELTRLGYRGYRAADVRLYHRSPCRNPVRLAAHHFTRGRALARIVLEDGRSARRSLGLRYVRRRLSRTAANVGRYGPELTPVFRRVMPLVVLGACSAWAGAWFQVLASLSARARRERARRDARSPSPAPPRRSGTEPRSEAEASRSSSPRTPA